MVVTTAQAVFVIYLIGVLLIGVYAARFTEHTPADFYLANRTVGTFILGMTLVATVLSSFTVFGIGGTSLQTGIGVFTFLSLAAVFYTFFFASVGVALYFVGRRQQIVTPSEYVRERFDSTPLSVLYLVVTGIFMIALVAGQIIGGGVALDILGVPYHYAIVLMAVFMLVFIHIAGYRGVIWSDTVQSIVLFGALGGVVAYVMLIRDGDAVAAEAMAVSDGLFSLAGPLSTWTPLAVITAALAFAFGVPAYPHSIQRYFSAADPRTMRHSGFVFAIVAIPVYLFGALLGAWALGVLPAPEQPDYVIPMMIETLMHPIVFGIVMAGAIAAIMSTADSVALTMSSMISRDVWLPYIEPDASPAREVRVTQAMLAGIILLSLLLAWIQPATIFALIEFAVVGFATTSAPVFLGVYWKRSTSLAAFASLLLGPGITVLFFLDIIPSTYTFGMHYGFIGVIVAYVIFIGVSLLTSTPTQSIIERYSWRFWAGSNDAGHKR